MVRLLLQLDQPALDEALSLVLYAATDEARSDRAAKRYQ
jgi:hypothetical protein